MAKRRSRGNKFPVRVSIALTRESLVEVDALAAADGDRPRGSWLRLQIERVLAEAKNGKAKK